MTNYDRIVPWKKVKKRNKQEKTDDRDGKKKFKQKDRGQGGVGDHRNRK